MFPACHVFLWGHFMWGETIPKRDRCWWKRKFLLLLLPLLADYKLKTKPSVARLWPNAQETFGVPAHRRTSGSRFKPLQLSVWDEAGIWPARTSHALPMSFRVSWWCESSNQGERGSPRSGAHPLWRLGEEGSLRGLLTRTKCATFRMVQMKPRYMTCFHSNYFWQKEGCSLFRVSGLLASMATWMNIEMNKTVHVPVLEFCACIYLAVYFI